MTMANVISRAIATRAMANGTMMRARCDAGARAARRDDAKWTMMKANASDEDVEGEREVAMTTNEETGDVDARATSSALERALYLVATPIGNLGDVTVRALDVLGRCDCVLAEDTRRTAVLFAHYGIKTPLVSYHAHNEGQRREWLVGRLLAGEALAVVSDAGMPTVSDPGMDLARAASAAGVKVVPVPGPSAVLAALAGAALPTDEFTFIGFPPAKSIARAKRLKSFARVRSTLVMFVPPHKLVGTLEDALAAFGDRRCSVCRELTKVHEEFWRSTLSEAKTEFERRAPRGEITLVIEGAAEGADVRADDDDAEGDSAPSASTIEGALRGLLQTGVSPSEASRTVAKDLGIRRRDTYSLAQRVAEQLKK